MGTNILIKKGNLSQIARKMFNIFNDFGLYNRRQRAPTQRRQQCACNECRKTQRIQKRQGQNTIQSKLERMQIGNRDLLREEPLLVELEHPEFSTVDELVADEEIIIEPDA